MARQKTWFCSQCDEYIPMKISAAAHSAARLIHAPVTMLGDSGTGSITYVWNGHGFSTLVKAEAYRDKIIAQQAAHRQLYALAAAQEVD